jgi:phosphoribosyl 1,2-cyclic phosphodiesterase
MQVRFWGTRGSLPKPGPGTLRYGGNTSCVEVRTADGTLLIIDCGSGLHGLGQALVSQQRPTRKGHILISHTHWDHIQGIPFFAPFFDPGTEWDIYAPKGIGQSLHDTLAGQMQYAYFPVTLDQMAATIRFHELIEGSFQIGNVTVRTAYLNHPALTLAFRLEADGASVVYASDHEPFARDLASGKGDIHGQDRRHCDFLASADLVIHDGQFLSDEYESKIGWGHSTIEYAVAICRSAGVGRLLLTHHDPLRTDEAIDQILAHERADNCLMGAALEISAAAEGETIDLQVTHDSHTPRSIVEPASIVDQVALVNPLIVMVVKDKKAAATIREAANSDNIPILEIDSIAEALNQEPLLEPSLIVLEEGRHRADAVAISELSTRADAASGHDVPVLVVAEQETERPPLAAVHWDWLVKPFSSAYARTRLRAAILRSACRWERALTPDDEEMRLDALHSLGILDTPPEERFDRITRLATSLFNVPMALVSFVDRERQWFKSAQGIDVAATSREESFCAHAVNSREILVVPDAFQDARFSDNPLVTHNPRIRFYAGSPIFASGHCVGTLCVMDNRPHQFDAGAMELLRDLASLVETELQVSHTAR